MPTDPDDPDVSGPAGSEFAGNDAVYTPDAVVPEAERYTRQGLLGRGGMGVVYLARDHRLGRDVALKEASHTGEIAARLIREASVTAGLDHPGIVTVHDSGVTEDGRPFYAMRLVRGRPLAALLAERPTLADRLKLVRHYLDTANAVAYAHAHGVVHRDLKPANIMVGGFGETQVLDWGLAAPIGEVQAGPSGTPAYMSPEQARGAPADPRSDVWSLGAMLSELLGSTEAPPDLLAIAQRALAEPDLRYPDAGALAADVAAWLDGRPVSAHTYTSIELLVRLVRAWRAPLAVGAVGVVALLSLAAASTWRIAEERDLVTAAEKATRGALETSDANLAEALIAQARGALTSGSTAVAAVLASHAVTLADAPEAWGVLAATSMAARAERRSEVALPTCNQHVLLGPTDILCVTDKSVERWVDGRVAWAWSGSALATRVHAGHLYVEQAGGQVTAVNLQTGDGTGGWVAFRLAGGPMWPILERGWGEDALLDLVPVAGGASLAGGASVAGNALNRLEASFCPGAAAAGAAASLGRGTYAVICTDGRVGGGVIGAPPRRYVRSPATRDALSGIVAAELTVDDRYLVVGGTKGRVAVIDLRTGAATLSQTATDDAAWLITLSDDGTRVLIGGDRSEAEVRSMPDLGPLVVVPVAARAARFAPDGTLLLATATALTRWRLPDARDADVIRGPDGVTAVVYSPDGHHLATAHGRYEANVWDLPSGTRRATLALGAGTAKAAAFTPDGSTVWFGMTGASTEVWRPRAVRLDGQPGPSLPATLNRGPGWGPGFQARRAVGLASGVLLAVGYGRGPGQLLAVDTRTLERVALDGCPDVEWFDGAQSAGGEHAVLVGDGGQVVRIAAGPHLACRNDVAVNGAGSADVDRSGGLVVGLDSGVIRLDPAGRTVWRADYPGGRVLDVAVSADGHWVAAGGTDHLVRLWDANGRLRAVLSAHGERVASVDFRPDGRALVTGSWDGTARIWGLDVLSRTAVELDAAAPTTWGLTLPQALAVAGR